MTSFLYDTFTESSDTDLDNHTPEVGGAWTLTGASDAYVNAAGDFVRGALQGTQNYCYNAVVPPSNTYEIKFSIFVTTLTRGFFIIIGGDTAYTDGYRVRVENVSQRWYLDQYTSGLWQQISARYNGDFAQNDTVTGLVSIEDDYDEAGNRRITLWTDDNGAGSLTQRLQYDESDGVVTTATLPGKIALDTTSRDATAGAEITFMSGDVLGGSHSLGAAFPFQSRLHRRFRTHLSR